MSITQAERRLNSDKAAGIASMVAMDWLCWDVDAPDLEDLATHACLRRLYSNARGIAKWVHDLRKSWGYESQPCCELNFIGEAAVKAGCRYEGLECATAHERSMLIGRGYLRCLAEGSPVGPLGDPWSEATWANAVGRLDGAYWEGVRPRAFQHTAVLLEGLRWEANLDVAVQRESHAVQSHCEAIEPDGPVPPNTWRQDGSEHRGLPNTAYLLVKLLWDSPEKTATIEKIAESVFGDCEAFVEVSKMRDHASFANKFFRQHSLPHSVRVSDNNGSPTATLLNEPPRSRKTTAIEEIR